MLPPLSRRDFLRLLGAAASAAALPVSGCGSEAPAKFLTAAERSTLAAVADVILPPDDTPGGADLGAVDYVEQLLTVFDRAANGTTPEIWAGGPYSGRAPYSDGRGGASTHYPRNDFAQFLGLDRVATAAWRLRLYGSAAIGGGPNDHVEGVGPVNGLRNDVRDALAKLDSAAGAAFDTLDATRAATVFSNLDTAAHDMLVTLVSEAAFAAPEYGGNPDLAGWKLVGFAGDMQPLGYSMFDRAIGDYRELPDAPVSTPNPGPDPAPLDADTNNLLRTVVTALGGRVLG